MFDLYGDFPLYAIMVIVCVVLMWFWVARYMGPLRVIAWWIRNVQGRVPVESAILRYCDVNLRQVKLIAWVDGQVRKYPVHDVDALRSLASEMYKALPNRDDRDYPVLDYLHDLDIIESFRVRFDACFDRSPGTNPKPEHQ